MVYLAKVYHRGTAQLCRRDISPEDQTHSPLRHYSKHNSFQSMPLDLQYPSLLQNLIGLTNRLDHVDQCSQYEDARVFPIKVVCHPCCCKVGAKFGLDAAGKNEYCMQYLATGSESCELACRAGRNGAVTSVSQHHRQLFNDAAV